MRLGLFLAIARRRRAATNSNRVTVSFGSPPSVTPTTYAPSVSISGGPVSITTGAPSGVTPTTYAFVVSPVQIETGAPANVTPTTYAPTVSVVTDETAPVISAAWDEANNEIDLTITEDNYPVTVRWQIRAVATAAPDESAMLAGTGGILNGSYSASSTPDSEVIDVSSLTDATDYTLYVMVSDPAGNHSAISDDDFTYTDPTVTITTGAPSGVTPTTYAPSVSVSGAAVAITTGSPSSVAPTTYAPTVSVSGGASGNFTFSLVQAINDASGGTPATATFTSTLSEGDIIFVLGDERSGLGHANHDVTDNVTGSSYSKGAQYDNVIGDANGRFSASVWWRQVGASEDDTTPTITFEPNSTSTGTTTGFLIAGAIRPSATYNAALSGVAANGSGTADWDGTGSGNATATGDDILELAIAAARNGSDLPTAISFTSQAGGLTEVYGFSNKSAMAFAFEATSQAAGTKSTTVNSDGSGNEGIAFTVTWRDA